MDKNTEQHVQAVLYSGTCSLWIDRRAHAMSILEAAEKMTGIPYTKHCTTCGRPMVCTDCLISRLRNDWRLERAKPDSYEEWAEVARDVMELFAEEEGEQEEAQSEPAKSQSN